MQPAPLCLRFRTEKEWRSNGEGTKTQRRRKDKTSLRRDEGDGMFEVLHTVVVAVHHLAVYDQPEGFVAGNLHRCSLAVFHQSFHFGAVDVGAFAVVVDEAGEFEERHGFEKVHFQKTVVVFGEGC